MSEKEKERDEGRDREMERLRERKLETPSRSLGIVAKLKGRRIGNETEIKKYGVGKGQE